MQLVLYHNLPIKSPQLYFKDLTPLHFAYHLRDLGENYKFFQVCSYQILPITLLFCSLSSSFRLCSKRW